MPRVKIPRKSTHVDMTAFCDVAFLLLSFFMLATKFKPQEAVEIQTPSSVSSDILPEKDMIMVTIDKEGKVYFSMDPEAREGVPSDKSSPLLKKELINNLNQSRNLGLTNEEMLSFVKAAQVGVPFNQLKSFLALPPDEQSKVKMPGMPADSTNNELRYWLQEAINVFSTTHRETNLLIKGDNGTKYPSFNQVIKTFKDLDQYKFKLITAPDDVPAGSDLFKKNALTVQDKK